MAVSVAGWSLLIGSLIFSGSLYLMGVTGLRWLGAITPIGGVAMLVGWAALAVAAGSQTVQATLNPVGLDRTDRLRALRPKQKFFSEIR